MRILWTGGPTVPKLELSSHSLGRSDGSSGRSGSSVLDLAVFALAEQLELDGAADLQAAHDVSEVLAARSSARH